MRENSPFRGLVCMAALAFCSFGKAQVIPKPDGWLALTPAEEATVQAAVSMLCCVFENGCSLGRYDKDTLDGFMGCYMGKLKLQRHEFQKAPLGKVDLVKGGLFARTISDSTTDCSDWVGLNANDFDAAGNFSLGGAIPNGCGVAILADVLFHEMMHSFEVVPERESEKAEQHVQIIWRATEMIDSLLDCTPTPMVCLGVLLTFKKMTLNEMSNERAMARKLKNDGR